MRWPAVKVITSDTRSAIWRLENAKDDNFFSFLSLIFVRRTKIQSSTNNVFITIYGRHFFFCLITFFARQYRNKDLQDIVIFVHGGMLKKKKKSSTRVTVFSG